jgi:hypothetical protein
MAIATDVAIAVGDERRAVESVLPGHEYGAIRRQEETEACSGSRLNNVLWSIVKWQRCRQPCVFVAPSRHQTTEPPWSVVAPGVSDSHFGQRHCGRSAEGELVNLSVAKRHVGECRRQDTVRPHGECRRSEKRTVPHHVAAARNDPTGRSAEALQHGLQVLAFATHALEFDESFDLKLLVGGEALLKLTLQVIGARAVVRLFARVRACTTCRRLLLVVVVVVAPAAAGVFAHVHRATGRTQGKEVESAITQKRGAQLFVLSSNGVGGWVAATTRGAAQAKVNSTSLIAAGDARAIFSPLESAGSPKLTCAPTRFAGLQSPHFEPRSENSLFGGHKTSSIRSSILDDLARIRYYPRTAMPGYSEKERDASSVSVNKSR